MTEPIMSLEQVRQLHEYYSTGSWWKDARVGNLCATVEELYGALVSLIALVEHETDLPRSAANGVVAPDGTDEGVVRAHEIIRAARDVLAQLEGKEANHDA